MPKNKKITIVFTSDSNEKPQKSVEEIAVELVKSTLHKLYNNI